MLDNLSISLPNLVNVSLPFRRSCQNIPTSSQLHILKRLTPKLASLIDYDIVFLVEQQKALMHHSRFLRLSIILFLKVFYFSIGVSKARNMSLYPEPHFKPFVPKRYGNSIQYTKLIFPISRLHLDGKTYPFFNG